MIKQRNRKDTPVEIRFFKYVDKTPTCWIWKASTNGWGYGQLAYKVCKYKNRKVAAHRLSWQIHNGKIEAGKLVLHKCDNRLCVNPNHLYLGLSQDNSDDMVRRGRQRIGENQPQAKLKLEEVLEIRELCLSGLKQSDIGNAYGVSQKAVSLIHHRVNWRLF